MWSLWVVASRGSSWGAGRPLALPGVVAWVGARVALRPAVSAMSPVNRIKDQCKVSVRIPPDSEKSSLIRIEGDPQGVRQAKRELLELASRMVSLAGPCCAPAAGPRPSPTQHPTAGVVPTCSCGQGSQPVLSAQRAGGHVSPLPETKLRPPRGSRQVSACSACLICSPWRCGQGSLAARVSPRPRSGRCSVQHLP